MNETTEAFVRLESGVWDALVRGDPAADAALLTPDFLGVYPTGFATRTQHADQLRDGPTMASYAIEQPVTRTIAPDHVMLAYRADYRRTHASDMESMYISSLWSRIDGVWLNVFSQDTPVAGRPPA